VGGPALDPPWRLAIAREFCSDRLPQSKEPTTNNDASLTDDLAKLGRGTVLPDDICQVWHAVKTSLIHTYRTLGTGDTVCHGYGRCTAPVQTLYDGYQCFHDSDCQGFPQDLSEY
jgi:hypothetical protein